MEPRQSALEINGIGCSDWTIRTQFNRGALDKCPCRHDDIAVIPRHRIGNRRNIAVHRGRRLNPLTECLHCLGTAQLHRLNDIMTGLCAVGNHAETQLFIHIRRKNSPLQCPCRNRRGKEKALIQRTVQIQRGRPPAPDRVRSDGMRICQCSFACRRYSRR